MGIRSCIDVISFLISIVLEKVIFQIWKKYYFNIIPGILQIMSVCVVTDNATELVRGVLTDTAAGK